MPPTRATGARICCNQQPYSTVSLSRAAICGRPLLRNETKRNLPMRRLIVGLSGSSGVIFGIRLLEVLKSIPDVETHLILSKGAVVNIGIETDRTPQQVAALADVVHDHDNLAAAISSGSYAVHGMAVVPCSMKSLAQIALSLSDNLLSRAADVTQGTAQAGAGAPRDAAASGHLRYMVSWRKWGRPSCHRRHPSITGHRPSWMWWTRPSARCSTNSTFLMRCSRAGAGMPLEEFPFIKELS